MSSPPLQVIALISGGKDSFFSLLHCLANEHTVVALANVYPVSLAAAQTDDSGDQGQDANSYMYQTVGHTLIPLYASALGIQVYRQQIAGSAVDMQKEYSAPGVGETASTISKTKEAPATQTQASAGMMTAEDETESLLPLLRRVMAAHPHANALSAGAILSTYQRTRIESIALRLGLVPLAYLWQYPCLPTPMPSPAGLLRDMAAVGLDARIIKVASGGLDDRFLWENVCEETVGKRMEKAVGRFGGSVLGEGGEYETLVVSGPRGVWKGEVVVESEERIVRWGEGGAYWLEFKEGRVEKRAEVSVDDSKEWSQRLKKPSLWDARFEMLLDEVNSVELEEMAAEAQEAELEQLVDGSWTCTDGVSDDMVDHWRDTTRSDLQSGGWLEYKMCAEETKLSMNRGSWRASRCIVRGNHSLSISNMTCLNTKGGIEDQMAQILSDLRNILIANGRSAGDIVFATVLLRSMSDFSKINLIYGQLFTAPIPPARVTVSSGETLPPGVDVMLSVVVDLGLREERQGLHVQSRSYWAPANIGPYSQAISCKHSKDGTLSLVHIAGQIPLVPASMEVLQTKPDDNRTTRSFERQSVLALQHLWRIGLELQVNWWSAAVAFFVADADVEEKALITWCCWKRMHQPPVLDVQDDDGSSDGPDIWDRRYNGLMSSGLEEKTAHSLPEFSRLKSNTLHRGTSVPAFFAVQVEELPRGCDVEWQSLGIAHQSVVHLRWCSMSHFLRSRRLRIESQDLQITHMQIPLSYLIETSVELCSKFVTRHNAKNNNSSHITLYTSAPASFCQIEAQIIPCKRIWGSHGVELIAGLVVQ
ncbi:hypothetical protein MMC13_000456 [Lambiella insularis]|nr:hypothetical protein [Lambiella insularis]